MANEGALDDKNMPNYQAFNADDNGGISVGIRQWHAGGALPELLNAWKNESPEKFNNYFHGMSPAQINNMSAREFNANPDLVQGMKGALADKQYQGVQADLMMNWVRREVQTGMGLGLTSEKEIATFVDIANQYGQGDANRAATIGRASGDQGEQMNAAVRGGAYSERYAQIDSAFSSDNVQIKAQGDGGGIVQAADGLVGQSLWAQTKWARYCENGNLGCAASVSKVLQSQGFGYADSAGVDNLVGILAKNGWQRVPLSQAQGGDVLWNSHHIGLKAGDGDYIYDNSSASGKWTHRRMGNSGLSDGPVYAMRPPEGSGSSQTAAVDHSGALSRSDNGNRVAANVHEPEAEPKPKHI